MATPSSSKKIQRVQRAGVSRAKGQRRPMGYTALVLLILIVGSVLVLLARDSRLTVAGEAPDYLKKDHWHAAFGIYVCDKYLPNLEDQEADTLGINTNGDGLMHVAPLSEASSGKKAKLQLWFNDTHLKVEDGKFTMPDGTVYKDGDACGEGKTKTTKTKVVMFRWPPQSDKKTKPKQITSEIGNIRYTEDGLIFALALIPEGEVPNALPPSVEALKNPVEEDGSNPTSRTGTSVPAGSPPVSEQPPGTGVDSTTVEPPTTVAPATTVAKSATTSVKSTTTRGK